MYTKTAATETFLGFVELGSIDRAIEAALDEDLATGDVTTRATVPRGAQAQAVIIARETLLFCGGEIARRVFSRVDADLEIAATVEDGAGVKAGQPVLSVRGRARSILAGERVALNLLQRACAVATLTHRYVQAAGPGLRVCDTRKTMPGLRALDRYAVRCGGGHNHRNDLGSGILIKENHIRAARGVAAAVRGARSSAPHGMRIECEVQTKEELCEAVAAGAHALLLDNMDDAALMSTITLARGLDRGRDLILEVSGGVTIERLPRLAKLDVDVVSVGALTHSAPAMDLSLLFELGA